MITETEEINTSISIGLKSIDVHVHHESEVSVEAAEKRLHVTESRISCLSHEIYLQLKQDVF